MKSLYSYVKGLSSGLFGEFALFSSSTVALSISSFMVNLVTARFLGPKMFGLRNALVLVTTYGTHLHFGTLNGMNRDVPLYRGKGNLQKVEQIRRVTLGVVTCSSLFSSFALFFFAWIFVSEPLVRISLQLMALVLCSRQYYYYLAVYLKSDLRFDLMSYQQFIYAALLPLIALPLVKVYGLYGYIISQAFPIIAASLFIVKSARVNFGVEFDLQETFRLIKVGFPIMVASLLYGLLTTVDRWVILKFLGVEQLGYYSLALMSTGMLGLLPSVVAQQIYPRMAEEYGKTKEYLSLKSLISKQIIMSMAIIIPALAVIYFFFPPFVKMFLSAYLPGIAAMKIALLGLLFFPLLGGYANFLITVNKTIYYMAVQGGAIIVNLVLNVGFVKLGFGLEGVALGTTLTYLVYSVTLALVGWRVLIWKK